MRRTFSAEPVEPTEPAEPTKKRCTHKMSTTFFIYSPLTIVPPPMSLSPS